MESNRDKSLIDLALAKFETISAGEALFLQSVESGEMADLQYSTNSGLMRQQPQVDPSEIRADCISWLLTDPVAVSFITHRGIQLARGIIVGSFDLSHLNCGFPLTFRQCLFQSPINIQYGSFRSIDLQASFVPGLDASFARIDGDLIVGNGFKCQGELRLMTATIAGSFFGSRGEFSNGNDVAILGDGLRVNASVILKEGALANGEVRFIGASIGVGFECDGSTFICESGFSLALDGIAVGRSLSLRGGFRSIGQVRLLNARIGSNLDFSGGEFHSVGGETVFADGLRVEGAAFFRGVKSSGGPIRLIGVMIKGDLDFDGATLSNSGGVSLVVDKSSVGGEVRFVNGFSSNGELRLLASKIELDVRCSRAKFENVGGICFAADSVIVGSRFSISSASESYGEFRLVGANIGSELSFFGSVFKNGGGTAILCDASQVHGSIIFGEGTYLDGAVSLAYVVAKESIQWLDLKFGDSFSLDLLNASTRVLRDYERSWPGAGSLRLAGFKYEEFGHDSPRTARARHEWINRQRRGNFYAEVYETSARALDSMGQYTDARELRVLKNKDRSHDPSCGWWERKKLQILGITTGYGYKYWRVFWLMLVFILIGWFVFQKAEDARIMKPAPDHSHLFHSLEYSIDELIPLVDLHEGDNWYPDDSAWGNVARIYLTLHIIAGWFFTTVLVAAITGLLKK